MDFPLFVDTFLHNAQRHPQKKALINAADGSTLTYAELKTNMLKIREWLAANSVTAGDKVILAAARDFRFIYFYLALHSMAAVSVPLDPKTPPERFTYIHQRTTPRLSLWPDASMPESIPLPDVDALPPKIIPPCVAQSDMLADIMFTSGTTGEPKGVLLTHGNLACAVNNIIQFVGNTTDDVEVCPMPLSHSFGIARLRCVLYAGGTYVLEDGVTRPKHLFQTIATYKATGLSMVGPAWIMLRKLSGGRISDFFDQLRYMELGSAPISAQTKKELADLLPCTHVCMHYGLTEASRAAFLDFHEDVEHLDTVGRASPLCEIAVFSPDGEQLTAGQEGEICVKGGMVTSGYLNPKNNEDAFFADGYFRTGDLGRLDAQGYVTLVGRLKEMINVGGEKVAPAEVEEVINSYPGVAASACVGQPDAVLGETVAAFVVLEDARMPIDFDNLKQYLTEKLEGFKIPKKFSTISELPTTSTGKIQRSLLKEKKSDFKILPKKQPEKTVRDTDPALYYAEKAVKAAPMNRKYREFLISLFFKRGKNDNASKCIHEGLEIDADWACGWHLLAKMEKKNGCYKNAEEYEFHAQELRPDKDNYCEAYANYLIKNKKYNEALSFIDKRLVNNKTWAYGWHKKSILLKQYNNYKDAEFCASKALSLNPNKLNFLTTLIKIKIHRLKYIQALLAYLRFRKHSRCI
jgi:long-chain acyl-CoA synthetase